MTGGRGSLATAEAASGSIGPLCHESFLPVRVAAWSVATAGVPAATDQPFWWPMALILPSSVAKVARRSSKLAGVERYMSRIAR